MTIRGGGNPIVDMAGAPRFRMGPPPRSFAADAYDCIMVRTRSGSTEYRSYAVGGKTLVSRRRPSPSRGNPVTIKILQRSGAAGTSNSTNVRLTRRKSTLFQWLAVPLWVPTGKDSVPTDSGGIPLTILRSRNRERSPYRDREPRSPLRAYWSVYELTPPSAELEAGGWVEKHSNGMPRICWHTIFTVGTHSSTASH